MAQITFGHCERVEPEAAFGVARPCRAGTDCKASLSDRRGLTRESHEVFD
jgi:hypothetical protein